MLINEHKANKKKGDLRKKNRFYFLLILVAFFLCTNSLYSQNSILDKKLNLNFKNSSAENILIEIEKDINHYFTYDEIIINNFKEITLSLKKVILKECLDTIFHKENLEYKIIGKHIILKQKNKFIQNNKTNKDTAQKSIEIRGFIVDKKTNKAISFASISIKDFSIGVISNREGEFLLKIPPSLKEKELIISHIGYENSIKKVDSLKNRNTIFKLNQSFIPIQEVIIRKTDPKYLLNLAIKKTGINYSNKANYLNAFYRETIKRNGEYMFFSEAILKIHKSSYNNKLSTDQIKVLKSRKMKNITLRDTLVLKLKSGLQSALLLDVMKNNSDFLLSENFKYYNYRMVDIITYNNRTSYCIEFEQKKNVLSALYKGRIYIDTENLAIIGVEFKVNPQQITKAQNNFVIKKTKGMKIKLIDTKYLVSYRSINGKFYLSYVRAELEMKVKKKKKLFPTSFKTTLELAISNVDSVNVTRFNRKEIEKLSSIFSDVEHQYDETFWEAYNFIKPDDTWQEAIRKIHSKLNKH